MSLATNYFNFQTNNIIFRKLDIDIPIEQNLSMYNKCFLNLMTNSEDTKKYIQSEINNYIDKNYLIINESNGDINYYIEKINLFLEKKFSSIIDEINISHIISLCDYVDKDKKTNTNVSQYIYWRTEYYKIIYDKVICGLYKVNGMKDEKNLFVLLDEIWDKINFSNIVDFSNTLNKIKFLGQNVDEYTNIFENKFDSIDNITKLLDYIGKKLLSSNITNTDNDMDEIENCVELDDFEKDSKLNKSKYNFRFIVSNLKSNGYLLYEELNKLLKNKYKKEQQINIIKTDKRIINYFIYLISQKDSDQTNRKVNEMLIKIKNYLDDIEDSYYNNMAYRKITVRQESEKYKSIDLSHYNRDNTTFTIFKYSNMPNLNTTNIINMENKVKFTLNKEIEPYFDIYRSYYSSRYPDREIEFDPYQSTIIVKMVFCSKPYYIHMALIQYMVMDKILKSDSNVGIGIKNISTELNIPIKNLQDTINSLLHIKLIKRSTNFSSPIDMKLFVNTEFEHNSNKISISSLVLLKEKMDKEEKKEFMHDRNTIILSNIYDYVKKNRTFEVNKMFEDLRKNKIPFDIELDQVMTSIKIMLEKEDLIETNENNIKIYKYYD